jgi:hypothetical protein
LFKAKRKWKRHVHEMEISLTKSSNYQNGILPEVFTAAKGQVEVFWVVTSYCVRVKDTNVLENLAASYPMGTRGPCPAGKAAGL